MANLSISAVAFFVGLCVILYRCVLYPAFFSPLCRIPNAHWSAPFSSLWILWTRYTSHENREIHETHKNLGSVVRIGPNEISVSSVDGGIKTIYSGGFEKGDWYSIFDNYGVPCMFSSLHARPHSVRKRMVSGVYAKSSIHNSDAVHAQARAILFDRLMPIIDASALPSTHTHGIDVHSLFFGATMDFITAYQFGLCNASKFLTDPAYREHWLELYLSRKSYTFFPQELPRITRLMHGIGIRLVPRWVDNANQEIGEWVQKMCAGATQYARSNSPSIDPINEPTVLRAVLTGIEKEEQSNGSDSVVSDTMIKDPDLSVASEMLDHCAAGFETSGITMTYVAWHLSQDLGLQKALREELLTLDPPLFYDPAAMAPITGNGDENPLEKVHLPSSRQLDSLPLLHAILMETLRVRAAIPGSQPRMSPSPSSVIGGYEVPGNTRVSASAWTLHRDPSAFPNPDVWEPSRFLDVKDGETLEGEARKDRDRFFWAFSSGGRMCIGSNFAMHELKLIIAAIYTNYTTHVVNDEGIQQADGYTCGPVGNKLILRFEKVVR